jgi:hypothetical protein
MFDVRQSEAVHHGNKGLDSLAYVPRWSIHRRLFPSKHQDLFDQQALFSA